MMTLAPADKDMIQFIRDLPKTEIHIHIEAAVSSESYMMLNTKYGVNDELKTIDDYQELFNFTNLSDMIKSFLYLQSFFRETEDYRLMVTDLATYAKANNIYYIEAFFSPSSLVREGRVQFNDVIDVLIEEIEKVNAEQGLDIRLIIDVSRTFGLENAQRNLDLLKAYLDTHDTNRILGIGLGGAEQGNSCATYEPVFAQARELGWAVVAHAGEEVDSSSIWDAVKKLGAMRIGHGTSAVFDDEIMDYLKENNIPLEICPTSNIITKKYVSAIKDHPIRQFFDRGMPVTVNTDDPILFNITLNKEYYKLYKFLGFGKQEIVTLLKASLFATFKTEKEKAEIWEKIEKQVSALA